MSPLLLDTNAAIWLSRDELNASASEKLDEAARVGVATYLSPITAWEVGLLVSRSRLSLGSIALPPLLLVLGTMYSLHVVAEYYELAQPGRSVSEVVRETLRNTGNLTFGQIANVGQVNNTGAAKTFLGFPAGPQQVSTNPGPDGMFGTADDLIDAGPDQIFGTSDDVVNPNLAILGVTRQIQITSLSGSLKKVEVTVNYSVSGSMQQLKAVCYLNDNSRSTFIP